MAAIISYVHGGRQGINDTCPHGQLVRAHPEARVLLRKVIYRDPDGNEIGFGGAALK